MELSHYFAAHKKDSANTYPRPDHERNHLPLLASPINYHVLEAMSSNGSLDLENLKWNETTGTFNVSQTSSGNPIIYKRHHEASTIELFYDLFFVANLAYFVNLI